MDNKQTEIPTVTPEKTPEMQTEPVILPGEVPVQPKNNPKLLILSLLVIIPVLAAGLGYVLLHKSTKAPAASTSASTSIGAKPITTTSPTTTAKVDALQLDPTKNYGNKYANGLLPVGDGKYVTDAAKKGYIYSCNANFVPAGQAGAQVRGPWFTNNNTQYDLNKKSHIAGSINWTQSFSMSIQNGKRVIVTNDLPNHPTGIFPVAASDPAHAYDANPNSIKTQSLNYNLTAEPDYGAAQCMGGEVGIMLSGVALFDGFDAGGRDAGAWEVQDKCDGHPQNKGEYHYHTLSSCITDTNVKTVIGFALDGFPITGPKVADNSILTTDDLDECHGIVSPINLDGKTITMYHYVMTQDFPYSASCFRATATKPPGQPE